MAADDEQFQSTRMTLGEHLEELRKRVFRSVVVLALAFGVAWFFKEDLAERVMWPWRKAVTLINEELGQRYELELANDASKPRSTYFASDDPADKALKSPIQQELTAFGVGDTFFFALNVSLYFALFFGAPFVLWQVWQFIAAGLYPREKRLVHLYFPFSGFLFVSGVLFAYFFIIPVGLYYLSMTLPLDLIRPQMGVEKYFSFLSTMCLSMGAVFQLPILMIFMASIGIIEPRTFSKYRPHFIVIALFVAAIVTPGPDWVSQILMTIPMLFLYEIGILLARWRAKPRQAPGAPA